jgi:hypothetical protein
MRLSLWENGLSLVLRSKSDAPAKLADIRISIMELIRITSHAHADNITVRIVLSCEDDEHSTEGSAGITFIGLLRERVLEAPSNVGLASPARLSQPLSTPLDERPQRHHRRDLGSGRHANHLYPI